MCFSDIGEDADVGVNDSLERSHGLGGWNVRQREPSRGEIQRGDARPVGIGDECDEQRIALCVEQSGVGQRTRRDDPRDPPLDKPLARRRVANLIDDDCALAAAEQPHEMLVERVMRNARHRNRCATRLAARRQRDVEQSRSALGVRVEQLVEIAHPVEQQPVWMLALEAQVLLHHRRLSSGNLSNRIVLRTKTGRRFIGLLWTHSPMTSSTLHRVIAMATPTRSGAHEVR